MKVKTSITLSGDLVEAVDKLAGQSSTRSEFIETALRAFIAQREREEKNRRDLEIINRRAHRLNKEAEDVLAFQGE